MKPRKTRILWVSQPEYGIFRARLNRFAALVEREGLEEKVFLPNTGRLEDLLVPGREVLLEKRRDRGKTQRDLLAIRVPGYDGKPIWVGLDARMSGPLLGEVFGGATSSPRRGKSVLDLFFPETGKVVEAKSVNLLDREGVARFPDAPTLRGQRHLQELLESASRGEPAGLWFAVFREDARSFCVFGERDPAFARLYERLFEEGVDVRAFRFRVTPTHLVFLGELPVCRRVTPFPGYWMPGS